MQVSKREVAIGLGVGEDVVISSGLELGETIVTAGVSSLSNGMKVSAWENR